MKISETYFVYNSTFYLKEETYPNCLGTFIFRGFFSFSIPSSFRLRFFIPRSSLSFNFAIYKTNLIQDKDSSIKKHFYSKKHLIFFTLSNWEPEKNILMCVKSNSTTGFTAAIPVTDNSPTLLFLRHK